MQTKPGSRADTAESNSGDDMVPEYRFIQIVLLRTGSSRDGLRAVAGNSSATGKRALRAGPASPGAEPRTVARTFEAGEFRRRWLAATDHQGRSHLTNRYGISELESLRLIGDTWANPIPIAAVYERLGLLVETRLRCNLEFTNSGTRQVRSGPLSGLTFEAGRMTLCGPDWSWPVGSSEIDSTWLVTRPGTSRLESSIELYGRDGQAILRLYGTSEPQENAVWHDLLETLPTLRELERHS